MKMPEERNEKKASLVSKSTKGTTNDKPASRVTGVVNKYLVAASAKIVARETSVVTSEIDKFLVAARKKRGARKEITQEVSAGSKEALKRKGDALVKHHGHGCRHYGILDLPSMTQKSEVRYYCQEGRGFYGTSCLGCQTKKRALNHKRGLV